MEYFRQRFHDYLQESWPLRIESFEFGSAEVFKAMAEADYEASFSEWTQREVESARERVRDFLGESGCWERFEALSRRHHSGHLVPIIGAGMSAASGMPLWGTFLTSLLSDAPQVKKDVEHLVSVGAFEEAAQVAETALGTEVFAEEIRNRLGSRRSPIQGAVGLLPLLFRGEVLTTNFDYVLTSVYRTAGQHFISEIGGAALREALSRLAEDPHCLLRLHGEAASTVGRVLTLDEYNTAYTKERTLSAVLGEICGPRSFVFLGCSLRTDRLFQALKAVKESSPLERVHYAFLPLEPATSRSQRRTELAAAGIHPIYYPEGQHEQSIEDMLITLIGDEA